MKRILFLTLLVTNLTPCAVYIIIHGTWCKPFNWHMPGGDFFEALKHSAMQHGDSVTFLNWSGSNNHEARVEGAKRLIYMIKTYSEKTKINLVAHSHGTNVGIIASQLLAKDPNNLYQIHHFYALGTPVNLTSYKPNMSIIKNFYNFFSFSDMIQSVFGLFQREFPTTEKMWNIRIVINDKNPEHTDLHHSLIASWIPELWELLFSKNRSEKPGVIYFSDTIKPKYGIDHERERMRQVDRMFQNTINNAFRNRFPFYSSPFDQARR